MFSLSRMVSQRFRPFSSQKGMALPPKTVGKGLETASVEARTGWATPGSNRTSETHIYIYIFIYDL